MTTISFEFPDSVVISARKGEVNVTVDTGKLPETIFAYLFHNGLKQRLADSVAQATNDACRAIAGNIKEGESKQAYAARLGDAAKIVTEVEIVALAQGMIEKSLDKLYAGDIPTERTEGETGLGKGFLDYVILLRDAVFAKGLAGYADLKKVPERRGLVADWLGEKDGRLESHQALYATHLAELAKVGAVDLSDL